MSVPARHTQTNLEEAISLFRSGDHAGFKVLYRHFGQSVYRFCTRMLGDSTLGQDAMQDTFIRALEHCHSFKSDNFAAWLFTIARRICLNTIRARRTDDSFDEELHVAYTGSTTQSHDCAIQVHIDRALLSIPVPLREAVILRDCEGYSYEEIARIAGIELSLAKVRVHRGRMALRKILAPVYQEWHNA